MKQYTYPKLKLLFNYLLIFCLFFYGINDVLVLIGLFKAFDEYTIFSYIDTIVELILIYYLGKYLLRSNTTMIEFNEEGIKRIRNGEVKAQIKWNEIVEIGIANRLTPLGSRKRLYFSTKVLDEDEKANISLADSHCIYLSYINEDTKKYILKYYPQLDLSLIEKMK